MDHSSQHVSCNWLHTSAVETTFSSSTKGIFKSVSPPQKKKIQHVPWHSHRLVLIFVVKTWFCIDVCRGIFCSCCFKLLFFRKAEPKPRDFIYNFFFFKNHTILHFGWRRKMFCILWTWALNVFTATAAILWINSTDVITTNLYRYLVPMASLQEQSFLTVRKSTVDVNCSH